MRASRTSVAATLLTALAVVAGPSGSAFARSMYDGVWSVVVAAESGTCSGAYRYPVSIVNGYVRSAGDTSVNVHGRVSSGGRVNVHVSRGDQRAHGVGRLSRFAGGGTWSSPSGCAGRWEASRRG
jgi:hypothetical protein